MQGTVFDIQRFSTHDGPGIRTTVFLKGCPLSCLWCHNPEGISPLAELSLDPKKCIGCEKCADVCENGCHVFTDGGRSFERNKCAVCGRCADACAAGALSVVGKTYTAENVIEAVEADRVFYGDNGGMTLSGGEPFSQPGFAVELLRIAKERDINTAVETSGYCAADVIKTAARYTDLFLFDIKATGREEHRRLTGVYPDTIMFNLALLDSLGAKIVLRCPVIPRLNGTEEHYRAIAAVAEKYASVTEIDVEPYNPMAVGKAERFGKTQARFGDMPTAGDCEEIISSISAHTSKKVTLS